jgi:hypothetical protein
MNNPIFSDLRAPRAPASLKQVVLNSCKQALVEPGESDAQNEKNWFDRCLQAAAATAVLIFALTCFASFASDSTLVAAARFANIDEKSSTLTGKSGKNPSFILMRRGQLWP